MNENLEPQEALFEQALKCTSPEARGAFLDEACRGQPELRARLDLLLEGHFEGQGFLEGAAEIRELPADQHVGTTIGRYKLLERIGEGGFGVVYQAEQREPVKRRVALKIIKPGMDTKQVVARFEAERQALALMDHPGIAQVYDGGATETGRPYFVMELISGVPITTYCAEQQLSTEERLHLFVRVCDAVQHAHQKGIIHRDLKPSNILVTIINGRAVPKVIDFGVAKATQQELTEKTVFTQFHHFIGTPAYVSPEQAQLTSQDIDTRSDIYALGVLLYELLTGKTPFDGKQLLAAGMDEMRRIIREVEPVKPSTRLTQEQNSKSEIRNPQSDTKSAIRNLKSEIDSDLDWIVMKCLEKDRTRRYKTANGLATDVQRHLDNEPVTACPPSPAYRLQKLVQRNKLAFATAALISVCIVLALVTLVFSNVRVTRERNQKSVALEEKAAALNSAQRSEQQARDQLFLALRSQAQERHRRRGMGQRLDSLATVREAANIRRDDDLRDTAIAALALPDLRPGRTWQAWGTNDVALAFDANYERYARIDQQAGISVRTVADDRETLRFASGPAILLEANGRSLIFSPDRRFLAKFEVGDKWSIWRLEDAQLVLRSLPADSAALAYSSDANHVALAMENSIVIFDLNSGMERTRWPAKHRPFSLAFSPDNRLLAAGPTTSEIVSIYQVESGRLQTDFPVGGLLGDRALAWHPSGEYLAVSRLGQIQLWDVAAAARVSTLDGHSSVVTALSFHPSGNWLISDSWDGAPRLWQPSPGREWLRFFSGLNLLRFSKDGRYAGIALPGSGNVQLLEFIPSQVYHTFVSTNLLQSGDVSPDGRLLALGTPQGISIRKLPEGQELAWIPIEGTRITHFHPDGRLMASGPHGLTLWPIETDSGNANELRVGPPRQIRLPASCNEFSVAGDGRTLAIMSERLGKGWILDLDSGVLSKQEFRHQDGAYVAITPDGRWLVTSGWHALDTRLWDAQTGEAVLTVPGDRVRVIFSPDGREFVVSNSRGYTFFDTTTKKITRRFEREGNMHFGWFAYSRDAKMLAMETTLGVISLCEAATGRTIARLEDPSGNVGSWIWFTPDGTQLIAMAHAERAIRRWDLRALRVELKAMGLDWDWPEFPPPP